MKLVQSEIVFNFQLQWPHTALNPRVGNADLQPAEFAEITLILIISIILTKFDLLLFVDKDQSSSYRLFFFWEGLGRTKQGMKISKSRRHC